MNNLNSEDRELFSRCNPKRYWLENVNESGEALKTARDNRKGLVCV